MLKNTGKSIKMKIKRRVHTNTDVNQHKTSAPGRGALTRLSHLADGLVKLCSGDSKLTFHHKFSNTLCTIVTD